MIKKLLINKFTEVPDDSDHQEIIAQIIDDESKIFITFYAERTEVDSSSQ